MEDIPQVISESVVRTVTRAAEPNLVLTNLLQPVPMELNETFSEEFLGTIPGTTDWISPNDEPPQVEPIDSGASVGIQLRKFGLMMGFSEEVLARSRAQRNSLRGRRLTTLLEKQRQGLLTEGERPELHALMHSCSGLWSRHEEALTEAIRRGLRPPLDQ